MTIGMLLPPLLGWSSKNRVKFGWLFAMVLPRVMVTVADCLFRADSGLVQSAPNNYPCVADAELLLVRESLVMFLQLLQSIWRPFKMLSKWIFLLVVSLLPVSFKAELARLEWCH
jgi:hypothetical protein